MTLRRPEMPLLNLERRRTTFQQVELGYTENVVREEARRCLRCDICLRCGKCVEVCRDKMGINALEFGFLNFDKPEATDFRVTAERCILCGACAANCPNQAIRIVDRGGERLLSYCGTILNRQKLEHCQECGAVLGPPRYLEFLQKRTQGISPVVNRPKLCHACARRQTARVHADNTPCLTRPMSTARRGVGLWRFTEARKWRSSGNRRTRAGASTWTSTSASTASSPIRTPPRTTRTP